MLPPWSCEYRKGNMRQQAKPLGFYIASSVLGRIAQLDAWANSIYVTHKWSFRQWLPYITQAAKLGGGTWVQDFFEDFLLKNQFLSDYVVGGCPKYIFGKLRSFLKISEKKFFKIFLLGDSKPNWLKVPNVKNHFCRGLKTLKIAWPAKKSIFSKSEISLPQSNHGKRNIKLMLVRP